MHRIDGPGATVDNKFTDGDPVGGVQATLVTDDWLNAVQEEVVGVIESTGAVLDKVTNTQLLAAIRALNAARSGSAGGFTLRNKLINAHYALNQRGYVSGTATATTNQYTLDRWRVNVSGQNLVFSTAAYLAVLTAPAGGISQVIEGVNIEGGTYVLSWIGTATATVNGSAITKGGTVSLPAGTNATVAFASGTVSAPQLELGSVATAYECRTAQIELLLCQRYYQGIIQSSISTYGVPGWTYTWPGYFTCVMRVPPTLSANSSSGTNITSIGATVQGINNGFTWTYQVVATGSATATVFVTANSEI